MSRRTSPEILDDDIRKLTHVDFEQATVELVAGPGRADERGKLKVTAARPRAAPPACSTSCLRMNLHFTTCP